MTIEGLFGHVDAASRVFMSGVPGGCPPALTHAVLEHAVHALCGALTPARSQVLWPALGQAWPAGPTRCPACARVMSVPRA